MSRNTTTVPTDSLWKATQLALDMFAARGYAYTIKRFQTDKQLFQEYMQHIGQDLLKLSLSAIDGKGMHVFVCMVPDKQFKKEQATKLIAELATRNIQRLILIWSQSGSVSAIATLKEHYDLEIWSYIQAQSMFHRHLSVPMQRKLSKKEKAVFFKKYRLSSLLMGSAMSANTIMSKFLGFQPSDVIHIWRVTNEGVSRAYRLVK